MDCRSKKIHPQWSHIIIANGFHRIHIAYSRLQTLNPTNRIFGWQMKHKYFRNESNALPWNVWRQWLHFGCVYFVYYDIDTPAFYSNWLGCMYAQCSFIYRDISMVLFELKLYIYKRFQTRQSAISFQYLIMYMSSAPASIWLILIFSWIYEIRLLYNVHFYLFAVWSALSRFFGNAIINTRHISHCCCVENHVGPFKASSFIVLSNMHECQMQASMHQEAHTHTHTHNILELLWNRCRAKETRGKWRDKESLELNKHKILIDVQTSRAWKRKLQIMSMQNSKFSRNSSK